MDELGGSAQQGAQRPCVDARADLARKSLRQQSWQTAEEMTGLEKREVSHHLGCSDTAGPGYNGSGEAKQGESEVNPVTGLALQADGHFLWGGSDRLRRLHPTQGHLREPRHHRPLWKQLPLWKPRATLEHSIVKSRRRGTAIRGDWHAVLISASSAAATARSLRFRLGRAVAAHGQLIGRNRKIASLFGCPHPDAAVKLMTVGQPARHLVIDDPASHGRHGTFAQVNKQGRRSLCIPSVRQHNDWMFVIAWGRYMPA